jgi:hypothetical protein
MKGLCDLKKNGDDEFIVSTFKSIIYLRELLRYLEELFLPYTPT